MGMLQKLKSMLGLGRSREASRAAQPSGGPEANVTVEREPSTASENAVKGTDAGGQSGAGTQSSGQSGAQPGTAPDTGGQPSTAGSHTDQEHGDTASQGAAEPAGEPEPTGEVAGETREADNPAGTGASSDADQPAEPTTGTDEDVTVLNGIGPAYGERLEAAGIESVADLAAADAAEIAAETDLGEGRLQGWIEQARER